MAQEISCSTCFELDSILLYSYESWPDLLLLMQSWSSAAAAFSRDRGVPSSITFTNALMPYASVIANRPSPTVVRLASTATTFSWRVGSLQRVWRRVRSKSLHVVGRYVPKTLSLHLSPKGRSVATGVANRLWEQLKGWRQFASRPPS